MIGKEIYQSKVSKGKRFTANQIIQRFKLFLILNRVSKISLSLSRHPSDNAIMPIRWHPVYWTVHLKLPMPTWILRYRLSIRMLRSNKCSAIRRASSTLNTFRFLPSSKLLLCSDSYTQEVEVHFKTSSPISSFQRVWWPPKRRLMSPRPALLRGLHAETPFLYLKRTKGSAFLTLFPKSKQSS